MKLTVSDIVKRDAQVCDCGRHPVWAKLRGGMMVLACPSMKCDLYLSVKGHTLSDAVNTWNQEVRKFADSRKGN